MSKVNQEVTASRVIYLSQVEADEEFNVRKTYEPAKGEQTIEELAESIRRETLITPLTVSAVNLVTREPMPAGTYFLVSGFRRVKAMLHMCEENKIDPAKYQINAVVKEYGDVRSALLGNLIENVRNGMRPADQACRFADLVATHEMSAQTISQSCGLSRSHINNLTRCWRELPPEILSHWADPSKPDLPMSELFRWIKLEDEASKLAAFHEFLNPDPEGDNEEETDGGDKAKSEKPSAKDIKAALGTLLEKQAKAKDDFDPELLGKLKALQWVVGARKKM